MQTIEEKIEAARLYSESKNGKQWAVYLNGSLYQSETQNGAALVPRDIESCSKTLCALAAYHMVKRGTLPSLDTTVKTFVSQWATTTWAQRAKKTTTFRQLLSLTSGLEKVPPGSPPTYEQAVSPDLAMPMGDVGDFGYSPGPHSVLGKVLQIAEPAYPNPGLFIKDMLLQSAGVVLDHYEPIDGNPSQPHLGGGAHMLATELAKLMEWMRVTMPGDTVLQELAVNQCENPADPLYGVGLWLCMDWDRAYPLPAGWYAAAGANGQRAAVIFAPEPVIIVRLAGPDSTYRDRDLLRPFL